MANRAVFSIIGLSFILMSAKAICQPRSYVGIDPQIRRLAFRGGYGDNLMRKISLPKDFFVGLRVNPNLAVEIGYERAKIKPKLTKHYEGDTVCGYTIPHIFSPSSFKSYGGIRGHYINLVGFYPLKQKPEFQFFGSLGVTYTEIFIYRQVFQMGVFNFKFPVIHEFSKNKYLLRLGTGFQYKLTDNISIRASVSILPTRHVNLRPFGDILKAMNLVRLKNTVSYGVAFIWTW